MPYQMAGRVGAACELRYYGTIMDWHDMTSIGIFAWYLIPIRYTLWAIVLFIIYNSIDRFNQTSYIVIELLYHSS